MLKKQTKAKQLIDLIKLERRLGKKADQETNLVKQAKTRRRHIEVLDLAIAIGQQVKADGQQCEIFRKYYRG